MMWILVFCLIAAFVAWSLCKAASDMDELFDDLDRELARRERKERGVEP